jgi:DNA-binding winged helix-turn-helix (wHTH) protein/tetratricopeptide (TPR) repeat protein
VIYRFDQFELDTDRELLSGRDGAIALRGHALLVLKYLIERAPEVVSRDEILEHVWGHQALSESSIAQVIRDIRSALGDSARSPKHLATRYGRGYQFVGELETVKPSSRIGSGAASNAAEAQAAQSRRQTPPNRFLLTIVAAVVLFAGWQWYRGDSSVPIADAREPITLLAVPSPNGESLSRAFVDYLAFVLSNAIGADFVTVANSEDDVDEGARVVEISLASLESEDRRLLELAVGKPALDNPGLRLRFDEASDLVTRGLDGLLTELYGQLDEETRIEAGVISTSSFAVETLLRGMAAQFAGDVVRATELFEAALAEDPDFEFARYELAIAVRRNRDYERAISILQPMAERLDGDFWAHRINNALGIAFWRMGRHEEALDALRRAESSADSPAARAAVLINIGLLERSEGRLQQAEASIREALGLAEKAESLRIQASARNTLASILMRTNRSEEALVQLEIAREQFYETGNLRGYAAVLSRAARIHSARSERTEAESLLRLALGIFEQLEADTNVADVQFRLARIHRVRGEFELARSLASSALELARALEDDSLLIDCYQALATLALADQRYDQARTYGREALRLAMKTGRDRDQRVIRLGLIQTDFEASTAALPDQERLDRLIDEAAAADHRLVGIRAHLLASRNHQRAGRLDDARRAIERADSLLDDNDLRMAQEINTARAELSLARMDYLAAGLALDALERTNAPSHPLLMLRARLHGEQGDLKSAVETAGLAKAKIGDWWRPANEIQLQAWQAMIDP